MDLLVPRERDRRYDHDCRSLCWWLERTEVADNALTDACREAHEYRRAIRRKLDATCGDLLPFGRVPLVMRRLLEEQVGLWSARSQPARLGSVDGCQGISLKPRGTPSFSREEAAAAHPDLPE